MYAITYIKSNVFNYFLIFFLTLPAQADITSNLIAHYAFDDGTANDYSGNNNHGINAGATLATGKTGLAFSFNGVDNYVNFSTHLAILILLA